MMCCCLLSAASNIRCIVTAGQKPWTLVSPAVFQMGGTYTFDMLMSSSPTLTRICCTSVVRSTPMSTLLAAVALRPATLSLTRVISPPPCTWAPGPPLAVTLGCDHIVYPCNLGCILEFPLSRVSCSSMTCGRWIPAHLAMLSLAVLQASQLYCMTRSPSLMSHPGFLGPGFSSTSSHLSSIICSCLFVHFCGPVDLLALKILYCPHPLLPSPITSRVTTVGAATAAAALVKPLRPP